MDDATLKILLDYKELIGKLLSHVERLDSRIDKLSSRINKLEDENGKR